MPQPLLHAHWTATWSNTLDVYEPVTNSEKLRDAAGELDLAAATLNSRRVSHTFFDYPLKLTQCRLALALKDHAQAIAIINSVVEDSQPFKAGQYLPEALFLKSQAHGMNGEQDLAKSAFEQARRNVSRGFGHPVGEFSVARQCRTSLSPQVEAG